MSRLRLTLATLPEIDRGGEYPLDNAGDAFVYRCPTHCIHLYAYDGVLSIDGVRYPFKSGDLTCAPAGTELFFESDAPGRHFVIHFFDPIPAGTKKTATFELPPHLVLGVAHLAVLEQMRTICALFNSARDTGAKRSPQRLEAAFRLKALLLSLPRLADSPKTADKRSPGNFVWDEFLELVDANLARRLTLTWLAGRMNVGAGTLARKFREQFGDSVIRHVLRRKIERAKTLLCATPMTINEVGSSVGLPDPQHFNKAFRKFSGTSPSRFRAENKPEYITPPRENRTRDGQWRTTDNKRTARADKPATGRRTPS